MANPLRVKVIDSHTGGEPTRTVISGGPDLGHDSLAVRRERFKSEFDRFRSAITNEPRGSDALVGALLCDPVDKTCATGVIFFNNVGYLGMCGHGTIGIVATLAYLNKISPGTHRIETPVGTVEALLDENGEVTVANVPSYRFASKLTVEVKGHGPVTGDVAWGGNWFFLVNDHGHEITLKNLEELTDFTWRIRQSLTESGVTGEGGQEIDHIELFAPSAVAGIDSKNFVLCPGKAYDRSPCGTGTSAKLACLFADGKITAGQIWRQESVVGSIFEGSVRVSEGVVHPSIKGSAFITAEADLILDENDPFCMGIRSMTSPSYDVVIIGAGIVGAACALESVNAGMKTAIVEAQIVGGGATAAGMGHLTVMDDSEAQFALTNYSCKLWRELKDSLPRTVEYESCGTIWVAADEEEMAEVRRKEKYYTQRGVAVEVLDTKALASAEPNLRPGLAGGLRVTGDSVIYPPCAARFFVECAVSSGADLFLGQPVAKIDQASITLKDDSVISAGVIVNAAGSWSPSLTSAIDVKKRKGHLLITDRYPKFVSHQLVELGYLKSAHSVTADSVAFNIQPRQTGQMLIGSSRQYGVDSSQIDTPIMTRMLERAIEYIPTLNQLSSIRTWTGFRAATPDKLPLIGPHDEHKRLYLATGHEGLGITTSLGTAKLLVDQIVGRESAIPVEAYLPSRVVKEQAHA